MVFGRLCGWLLIAAALLMASGDAVMALGPGDHVGIAAADIWVLLAGRSPSGLEHPGLLATIGMMLMNWPAWAVVGPIGAMLVLAFRMRMPRRGYRQQRYL